MTPKPKKQKTFKFGDKVTWVKDTKSLFHSYTPQTGRVLIECCNCYDVFDVYVGDLKFGWGRKKK